MPSYSVASARAKLARIIDEVEAGRDVEIVRRGKKVAVLVSQARYAQLSGEKVSFGDAYLAFVRDHDLQKYGVDAGFARRLRDKTTGRSVKF